MSWPKCPRCKRDSVFCIDSRPTIERTRRRYRCRTKKCGHRFTTLEEIVANRSSDNKVRGVALTSIVRVEKERLLARIDKLLEKELKRKPK